MKEIKDYLHLYLGCELWSTAIDEPVGTLHGISGDRLRLRVNGIDYNPTFHSYKPILRPLSDMSEEEEKEYLSLFPDFDEYQELQHKTQIRLEAIGTVYLLSKGFDLFGLIESGLAIDKTKL